MTKRTRKTIDYSELQATTKAGQDLNDIIENGGFSVMGIASIMFPMDEIVATGAVSEDSADKSAYTRMKSCASGLYDYPYEAFERLVNHCRNIIETFNLNEIKRTHPPRNVMENMISGRGKYYDHLDRLSDEDIRLAISRRTGKSLEEVEEIIDLAYNGN